MKIKTQFVPKKLAVFVLTTIFMVALATTALALPTYTTASTNSSTNVYCLANSSSMVVGSIGVESVKVYWQENGYYYIEYTVSGGAYGGYKRGYVPTSKINVSGIKDNNYPAWPTNTTSNQTIYNRSATNSYVIGTVFSTDKISVIREDGSWNFVEYPVSGSYKRGYVPRSTVVSNLTKGFSSKLLANGAWMWYYAQTDMSLGTYPIGTGFEFANRVQTNGIWDYKQVFTTGYSYTYNGSNVKDQDLGNMHYGYVGRYAGFSRTLLSSAAGAYQIYSGTSSPFWYASYFDDPNDQYWINYGMNMKDNNNLPSSSLAASSSLSTSSNLTVSSDSATFNPNLFTPAEIDSLLTPQEKQEIKDLAKSNSTKIKNKQPLEPTKSLYLKEQP